MSPWKEKTLRFFSELDREHIDLVDGFYAPDCVFQDPVVSLRGKEAVKAYYAHLYANAIAVGFEFGDAIVEDDRLALAWVMTVRSKSLRRGKPVVVAGISHLRFDRSSGLAAHHRDHFDMGAFIYEHVPLLGGVVRRIKQRIARAAQ